MAIHLLYFILAYIIDLSQSDASIKRVDIVSDSALYYFTLGDIVSAICMDAYTTDYSEYLEIWYVLDPAYFLSFHGLTKTGMIETTCRQARIYYIPWQSDASIKYDTVYIPGNYNGISISNRIVLCGSIYSENAFVYPFLCITYNEIDKVSSIFAIGVDVNNQKFDFIARNIKYFYI